MKGSWWSDARRSRVVLVVSSALWLTPLAALAPPPASAQLAPAPVEPEAVTRKAAAAPIRWKAIDLRNFFSQPGTQWTVYLESAETGQAVTTSRTVPIRQTRLRIALQQEDGNEQDLAYVQHTGVATIEILRPGDPRLEAAPVVRNDAPDPWPTSCGFNFVDTPHTIDIDEDDRLDLPVKFYATSPDPDARGLLLLDEGPDGVPNLASIEDVVEMIDPRQLALQDLVYPENTSKPLLVARYRPLEKCRFLAQLGIPGESTCDDCCDMSVFLREIVYRHFVPTYYRPEQHGLLERVRQDITTVSSAEPGTDLRSVDQAALARMASFFYLTGQGQQTREQLETALGERKLDFRAQLLMDRLEKLFITPETLAAWAAARGSGTASGPATAAESGRASTEADSTRVPAGAETPKMPDPESDNANQPGR
ncbi:MAG: hypothetical protein KC729_08105 [Candidatus Eisenbacteria bacterium]|uniref:Uncharacterized protein n=1 Tax=Eiseniibacteriota bacterium TaxID=2212470 RepID=A0A956RNK4_UNCEI|nr:hypothetical protein [Candidatus Eisenbacteria bacterium]